MNLLLTFYKNTHEREAVREYLTNTLKELAIEKTFSGKDTVGIQEAKETIDRAFENLEAEFGEKEDPKPQNAR